MILRFKRTRASRRFPSLRIFRYIVRGASTSTFAFYLLLRVGKYIVLRIVVQFYSQQLRNVELAASCLNGNWLNVCNLIYGAVGGCERKRTLTACEVYARLWKLNRIKNLSRVGVFFFFFFFSHLIVNDASRRVRRKITLFICSWYLHYAYIVDSRIYSYTYVDVHRLLRCIALAMYILAGSHIYRYVHIIIRMCDQLITFGIFKR